MPRVDVVIPVFNEDQTLERQVDVLRAFLIQAYTDPTPFQIIIADNGSTDNTQEIGERLASSRTGVSYLRLNEWGVGRALKTAWARSDADIIGYMDLDLATDLNHLPEAISILATSCYDIVSGTRLHPDSHVSGRSLKRSIASRAFNFILKIYLGTHFSDGMCGFKFLRRSILPLIIENGAASDGWFFCTELLAVGEWHGARLYELPVKWTDDSNSKVRLMPLALSYLKAMRILKHRRPSGK